jgi:hypothetical protein
MILDVSNNIVQVVCSANRGKQYVVDFDRRTNTVINVYARISRLGYNSYHRLLYNYVHKNAHRLTAWCAINAARRMLRDDAREDYRRIGEANGY